MKGVELPINALIIIVLAIIVLVAIIALFYTGIKPPQNTLSAQAALDRACIQLHYNCEEKTYNILVYDFDADKDGKFDPDWSASNWVLPCPTPSAFERDNLFELCKCWFQIWDADFDKLDSECKKLCQC